MPDRDARTQVCSAFLGSGSPEACFSGPGDGGRRGGWKAVVALLDVVGKATPVRALSMTMMAASNSELPHSPPKKAMFAIFVPVLSSLADGV